MWFRITLFTMLSAVTVSGCDDEVCGASADSLASIATNLGDSEIIYGDWRSSPNNDCGETGGPVSLTLDAQQEGANFALTLCLPRPDKLSATPVTVTETTRIRIVDIFADVGEGCIASLDRTREASGTIAFPGLCGDGDGPDGYSLDLEFTAPMTIACDGMDPEATQMQLSGLVAVEAVQF